jgi:hypothetical protein
MADALGGPPPVPGMGMSPNGGPNPTFAGLAPGGDPAAVGSAPPTPGAMQIGAGAMKMALEIDQALKLLAQAVPQMGPWVEQTVMTLRQQVGNAMQQGIATSPVPSGAPMMPDGGNRL